MATLADSLVSSVSRPLTLRTRPDLSARRHRYHGRTYWVIKEPVGLNYFRFHEEEYAILQMLDGHTSLERIKEAFEREFTPQKITYQDLQRFVGMLHRSGLVTSEAPGQGRQLKRRRDEKKRKELLGRFSNVFALRYRGIDPERFLNWLYPYTGWFFRRWAVIFFGVLAFLALSLVAVQFDVFRSRLPTFHQFFGAHNWIFLGVTLGLVKVLHEFGHGLSCKHFGGECHEMGFMLLVFTPCLYCNVSDSWMLPNKWHRAAIGAAGMYVEGVIATFATFIWWFSEPGLLNHLCLSMMFICSVSTLLFNGNPLLRFDGYYIMMDLTEIPNLRQKSSELLKRFLSQLCLGIEQPENPFLPQRNRIFFGCYTVAAAVYRWIVVLSILMFLNKVLEPYGLKVLGQLVAAIGLFGLLIQPLWKLGKFFYIPGRMHKVKRHRVVASLGVVAALVAIVIFVPLPFHVSCTLTLEPRGAQSVFPDSEGRLLEVCVRPGQTVDQGDTLVHMENMELELEVVKLQGELDQRKAQLDNLRYQRHLDDGRSGLQIAEVLKIMETIEEQLREKTEQMQRLEVKAPVAGDVLPPPDRPSRSSDEGRLPEWSGSPFEKKNVGAYLSYTDAICRIGDPNRLEAVLVVDQTDIDLVSPGDSVVIKLESLPDQIYETEIYEIASSELKVSPATLSSQAGGELNTRVDSSGVSRPMSTSYQARTVPLEDDQGMLRMGLRGRAKIYTGWRSLGSRLYRFLARTFHFEL